MKSFELKRGALEIARVILSHERNKDVNRKHGVFIEFLGVKYVRQDRRVLYLNRRNNGSRRRRESSISLNDGYSFVCAIASMKLVYFVEFIY